MRTPDRRRTELNEVRWWSEWARLRWHGKGYLLTSDTLKEPFFNRAGALTCGAARSTATWAEGALRPSGIDSTVLVFDSCPAAKGLLALGYRQTDTMTVLLSTAPVKEGKAELEVGPSTDPNSWAIAYLRSFYGDETLAGVVRPIISSLQDSRAVTLLEARGSEGMAGVLALFRTQGIAGAYCVGTVPEFRRMGVATALLARAGQIASEEGRSLILQTLSSDGVLQFYLRRGFVAMYSKKVLTRKLK
ncbi:MAG: GNAT family N-acetyltransferase [Nitrososphaerota archaeon]|nr:GNAT family N-acetyltransferase [Nitrososphaerota archaeon]MDG7023459.1 GNAT family N-acetyltransferase [Nitrososphaerota archaeon]